MDSNTDFRRFEPRLYSFFSRVRGRISIYPRRLWSISIFLLAKSRGVQPHSRTNCRSPPQRNPATHRPCALSRSPAAGARNPRTATVQLSIWPRRTIFSLRFDTHSGDRLKWQSCKSLSYGKAAV